MLNPKLEKAVRLGLQMSAGKTMDEAVQEMMECLELVIDIGTRTAPVPGREFQIPPAEERIARKAPVLANDVPVEALADLVPIGGAAPGKSKVRVYWEMQELQDKILAESPGDMEIQVNTNGDKIKIYRSIMQEAGTGAAPGIQLSYKPQNPDRAIPYPKQSFWVTDEHLDLLGAVATMRAAAESMYRVRSAVPTKLVADKPLRFQVGGEVS